MRLLTFFAPTLPGLSSTALLASGCLVSTRPGAPSAGPGAGSTTWTGDGDPLAGCALPDVPDGGEDIYRYVVSGVGTPVIGFTVHAGHGVTADVEAMDPDGADLPTAHVPPHSDQRDRFELIAEAGTTVYLRAHDA